MNKALDPINNKEITIEHDYTLEASLSEVFSYLSNPENDPIWQSSCNNVTMHNQGESILTGTKYTIHFSFLSRKLHFEAQVEEFELNQSYGYKSLTGPMPYRGRYDFIEVDGVVSVRWFFTAIPGKFFGIIPKSLIRKTMLKKTTEDIARLQKIFALAGNNVTS